MDHVLIIWNIKIINMLIIIIQMKRLECLVVFPYKIITVATYNSLMNYIDIRKNELEKLLNIKNTFNSFIQ